LTFTIAGLRIDKSSFDAFLGYILFSRDENYFIRKEIILSFSRFTRHMIAHYYVLTAPPGASHLARARHPYQLPRARAITTRRTAFALELFATQ